MAERTPLVAGLTVAPNAPGDATNPAASEAELRAHRFWGRFADATFLPNATANPAGSPAYDLMRPGDVAFAQDTGRLHVLQDRTHVVGRTDGAPPMQTGGYMLYGGWTFGVQF